MKKVLKRFCVAVFAVGLISGATFAEGLTNANITGINNSGSFANTANGMQVDINKTGTTDINWGKLNVNSGEVLDFNFNAANATAFNKVNALGGASILSGAINAIGTHAGTSSIIISNPAGVLFKDGAVINANVFNVDAGLNGAIDVNNLLIKKGNLSLTTKNGNISLNGLKYDNLGNLTINTVDGTISLANILGANKIEAYATSDGNILLGNAIPTTIGGKKIDGITADYLKLSVKNGNVKVLGKVTLGKDFLINSKAEFDGINNTVDIDNAVVKTPNGSFQISANAIGIGKNSNLGKVVLATPSGKSSIASVKILGDKDTNEYVKVASLEANRIDNLSLSFAQLPSISIKKIGDLKVLNNEWADYKLVFDNITINNIDAERADITLNNAKAGNIDFAGGSFTANNSTITSLIAGKKHTVYGVDKYDDNVGIALNGCYSVGYFEMEGATANIHNTNITTAVTDTAVLNLTSTGPRRTIGSLSSSGGTIYATNYNLNLADGNWGNVTLNNTVLNANGTAGAGSSISKLDMTGGISASSAKVDNFKINNLIADKGTSSGFTLDLLNSEIKNATFNAGSGYLNFTNNLFKNPITVTSAGTLNLYDQIGLKGLEIADNSYFANGINMLNSDLTANKLNMNNNIIAKGGSLNLTNSYVGHDLVLNEVDFNLTGNLFNRHIFLTNNFTNKDITGSEIANLASQMSKTKPDVVLSLGNATYLNIAETKINLSKLSEFTGGNSYSGNIDAAGVNAVDANNKIVKIDTVGNVDLNIKNVRNLEVNNADNINLSSVTGGIANALNVNKLVAKNQIKVSAADLKTYGKNVVGEIDSQNNNVDLSGIISGYVYGNKLADASGRNYLDTTIGLNNSYKVYANVIPTPPSQPEHGNNGNGRFGNDMNDMANRLHVNTNVYHLISNNPNHNAFANNVRGLAADDMKPSAIALSEIVNGFRIKQSILPNVIH